MPDIVDVAMDTTQYYAAPPPKEEKKPDLRSNAGRAAAGLPPVSRTRGQRAANAKKPTPRVGGKDYRKGIEGIGQLAAGALLFVAPADAAAVGFHTPPIAQALNDLAQEQPAVAAMLDKLLSVGPYAALLTAVTPLILQILCNHGKFPAGMLGTMDPEQLVGAFLSQQPQ